MREQEPRKPGGPPGHSRRDFLRGSGVAAATAVLTSQATLALDEAEAAEQEPKVLSGAVDVSLKINGERSRLQDRAAQHAAGRDASSTRRDGAEAGLRSRRAAARARPSSTAIRSIPAPRWRSRARARRSRRSRASTPAKRAFLTRSIRTTDSCAATARRASSRPARRSSTRTPIRPSTRFARGSTATSAAAARTSAF